MKVILKQDVNKLGKKGDLLEVSDGYARNFLFPRALAEEATGGKVRQLEDHRKAAQVKEDRLAAQAREQAKVLGGKRVVLAANAGEGGRLFGSVTNQQVAEAVASQLGVKVDKREIRLETVKQVGVYPLKVRLYPGVEADLTVSVEAQA